jgi:hypothetical protein
MRVAAPGAAQRSAARPVRTCGRRLHLALSHTGSHGQAGAGRSGSVRAAHGARGPCTAAESAWCGKRQMQAAGGCAAAARGSCSSSSSAVLVPSLLRCRSAGTSAAPKHACTSCGRGVRSSRSSACERRDGPGTASVSAMRCRHKGMPVAPNPNAHRAVVRRGAARESLPLPPSASKRSRLRCTAHSDLSRRNPAMHHDATSAAQHQGKCSAASSERVRPQSRARRVLSAHARSSAARPATSPCCRAAASRLNVATGARGESTMRLLVKAVWLLAEHGAPTPRLRTVSTRRSRSTSRSAAAGCGRRHGDGGNHERPTHARARHATESLSHRPSQQLQRRSVAACSVQPQAAAWSQGPLCAAVPACAACTSTRRSRRRHGCARRRL